MSDYLRRTDFFQVIGSMYLNEVNADVFFIFGPSERVPAHKTLLSSSEEFMKLFVNGQNEFKINEPIDVFKNFLKFFYMPRFDLDDVAATIRVAKKYGNEHILSTLFIFGYAQGEYGDLKDLCASNIARHTATTFDSADFLYLDRETLGEITIMDASNCDEIKILHHCVNWAKQVVNRDGFDNSSPLILRSILADLVYRIRFKSMSIEEFVEFTSSHPGFFSLEEFKDITHLIGLKDHQSANFSNKYRAKSVESSEYDYLATIVDENRLKINFKDDCSWAFQLSPEIENGLIESGIAKATAVQNQILPLIMANTSVAVTARPCEGKTMALIIQGGIYGD